MDSWRDLDRVIEHLLTLHPAGISAVGWSMGGLILARYLGESTQLSRSIDSAVTLSAPLDTGRQLQYMQRSWAGRLIGVMLGAGFLLQTLFTSDTRAKLTEFGIPLSVLSQIRSILDVDRLIVCPLVIRPLGKGQLILTSGLRLCESKD